MKRPISGIVLTVLLLSAFTSAFVIRPASAQAETVIINSDGSISPSSAPISSVDNITYTFTGIISYPAYDGIVIERNNIVVDGNGDTVQGNYNNSGTGLSLTGTSNVTIARTDVRGFQFGIYLNASSNNSITGNNITGISGAGIWLDLSSNNSISGNNLIYNGYGVNGYGVWLNSSSNNSITGNNLIDNGYGVWLDSSSNNNISGNAFTFCGLSVLDSYENSIENNTVNGKPLVYLEGVAKYSVSDAGQVVLVRCDSIWVENLDLSRASVSVELWETNSSMVSRNNVTAYNVYGVWLDSSSNNSITGNNLIDNSYGVWLDSSSNNSITGNNITTSDDGIDLVSSFSNSISGNNITAIFGAGVWLDSSSNNSITGNNITTSIVGIYLDASSNNSISGNKATSNYFGIVLTYSSRNYIYHNNFVNNAKQTLSYYSVNAWDNGYPSGGNYWSDCDGTDLRSGPYQNVTGSDNIGDKPYTIDSNNTDHYPLMNLYIGIMGDINSDGKVDMRDISIAAKAFGSHPGDSNWNPDADVNGDGKIDLRDIALVAKNFGQHYP